MNVAEQLDALSETRALIVQSELKKQSLKDSILTPEQKQQIKDIDSELDPIISVLRKAEAEIEMGVKNEVLGTESTVKGQFLQAVWSKGQRGWDLEGLESYAKDHPEILEFYKEGPTSL